MKIGENSPSEQQLSMPREKSRSALASLAYRFKIVGSGLFGKQRMLRLFLNGERLCWRLAFELTGETYGGDFHCHAKALTADDLKRWIPPGGSLVDIGCGIGRWCRTSSRYAESVIGIDFDGDAIAKARAETTEKNVQYLVGDVTRDLNGRKFDIALLSHLIEHIDDADAFLLKLHDIAPRLIIEVPDFESDPLNKVRLAEETPFYSDADHVREYTLTTLTEQLTRTGWSIIEQKKRHGAIVVLAEDL